MIENQSLITDKLYSVKLYDYYFHNNKSIDCFKVLGCTHFNGTLIAHSHGKLVFNLEDNKGSAIIPFENIKWMVPLYKKKEEGRTWLDDLQP